MSATRPPAFDDRFSTPIEASRRGAHRARPKPVSSGLPVIAGIAVVLLVIGGVYTVFSGGNGSSPGSGPTVAAAGLDDNDNPTSTGTPRVSSGPSAGKGAAVGNAAPTDQQSSGSSDGGDANSGGSGSVNRNISLVVLNSIAVQGLAKRVQQRIEPAGWKVQRTGNSTNRNLATTKIYYGRTADKATAEALQADLGFGTVVKDSTVVSKGLSVVLGQDADTDH